MLDGRGVSDRWEALEKRGLSRAGVVSKRVEVSDKSEVLGEWEVAQWGVWGLDGGVEWQLWQVVLEGWASVDSAGFWGVESCEFEGDSRGGLESV